MINSKSMNAKVNLSDNINNYNEYVNKKRLIIIVLFLVMLIIGIYAISKGSSQLNMLDTAMALLGQGSTKINTIIFKIRLPRVAMAIVAGIGLAISGCVMQSILKNPLASASTLGISQGASFGAAVAIVFLGTGGILTNTNASDAIVITNPYITSICAFLGSMISTFVVLALSKYKNVTPEVMILAGVALSSLFSGATALIQYFAEDLQVAAIVYWTFGDLGRASYREIYIVAIITAITFIYFFLNRFNYNALESGDQTAKGLGVNAELMRLVGMTLCSLTASVIVSFVGIINFIGLIAPHIIRTIIGNDYRFLLPASAIVGSILLLLSDTFARLIISPVILPIGAITSFLGAPLFLFILFKGADRK
ncbi:MAG: Transport system permease protein [Intestinibacter bartlettii DORA_8_9]|uniref:Hemin transport system permease protein HmuU n=1 Tax=Intestinibacter bartlettii TaxID=261299 RepID=A0A6N3C526_9FIRM|nr:MAG: Transport system permease protein [Intestinibacter bartlettii DORA_8_9]